MAATPLIPVILCGGTGTRLWPLSRASYPKQYWPLSGDSDATLLQQTQQRLIGLDALAAPLLICNEDHRFIVAEHLFFQAHYYHELEIRSRVRIKS